MTTSNNAHLVVAVIYDRLGTFEFGCVTEVFALPRPEMGEGWYRFSTCAIEDGPLRAMGGISVGGVTASLDVLDMADTIIIPGWRDPGESPPESFIMKLKHAHMRGARICSICSGAFALAWAGLLDGKSATTHWRLAETLKGQFPAIRLEADKLYVEADGIFTSAGSAAGLDMMLHLILRDHGHKVANAVAQRLNMAPPRHGEQAQRVACPMPPDEAGRVTKLMDWLRLNLVSVHTLASMARQATMSKRTLQRQFMASTGLSPSEWLMRERVTLATQLLEGARTPITMVGELTGFGSEESFRRQFRRMTGVSPAVYRRRLNAAMPTKPSPIKA